MRPDRLAAGRARRILKLDLLLANGESLTACAKALGVKEATLASDHEILKDLGAEKIRARIEQLARTYARVRQRKQAAGRARIKPRPCAYLMAGPDGVRRCGIESDEQYCEAHRELTAPMAGVTRGLKAGQFSGGRV